MEFMGRQLLPPRERKSLLQFNCNLALLPTCSLNFLEGMENGLAAAERCDHAVGRIELHAVDSAPVENFVQGALQNTRVFNVTKPIKQPDVVSK